MRLLYPLGLLGLIGVPILIIIYILRSKFNEQTVPSTYLWTLSEKFFRRRNPFSGLTGIISLILQILMVVLASLAIARPIFIVPDTASAYCFILDGSGSMNMQNGNSTNFEKAKEYIEDSIDSAKLGSSYTLVFAGGESLVIYSDVTDKILAKDMLSELSCGDGNADYTSALQTAQSCFDKNSSTLTYFVTDKDYKSHKNVEIVNVSSQNVENYAIYDVSGKLTDGILSVKGSLASYLSDATLRLNLYVNGSESPAATESVSVKGGEPIEVELSCEASSYSSFRLEIDAEDGFAQDNVYMGYNVSAEVSYSILIVSDTPFFLEAVFDTLTDSVIDTVSPEEYTDGSDYGLCVFQSYTPDVLPDTAVWMINSVKNVDDSGFSARGVVELDNPREIEKSPSTQSAVKRLLEGVSGRDIYVSEYVKYGGMYTKFTTLFSCDSNPLIFAGTNAIGNRQVVIGFDLHKSDIALSSDFAPLIANLLEYTCPDIINRTDFVCGDEAEINITSNISSVKAISPSGEQIYLDTSTDVTVLSLDEVGTYTLKVKYSDGERTYYFYSSSPTSEGNPRLDGDDFSVVGDMTYEKTDGEYDPLSLIFIIMALVFCADWMVFCYEKYQLR